MHYANGRPAKNGDKVLQIIHRAAIIGVLYDATPGNDYCNGMLAPLGGGTHVGACLADCVHLDDVFASLNLNLSATATQDVRATLAKVAAAIPMDAINVFNDTLNLKQLVKG
jgi:hypothetical protein